MKALRYKLRTFGINIDGPDQVFCDNQLVVKNLSIPTSTLKKIHHVIFYHWFREDQAEEIIWVGWIEGTINFAVFYEDNNFYSYKTGYYFKGIK